MKKLHHPGLTKVAEVMQRERKAGYQEAMVDLMVVDLKASRVCDFSVVFIRRRSYAVLVSLFGAEALRV